MGTPGPVVTSPAVARYLSAHGGRRPTKTSRGPRRSFSKQFKAEIVDLVRQPGNTPASVARNLDLSRGPRRSCSKQFKAGLGAGGLAAVVIGLAIAILVLRRGRLAEEASEETSTPA